MDISEFEVILRMDWLTTHRVVIDCDRRWGYNTQDVIVLCFKGRSMMLYPIPCMTPDGLARKPYPGGRGEIGIESTSGSLRV